MGSLRFLTHHHYCCTLITTLLYQNISITTTAHTLTPADSIVDGQTLTSQASKFELGFFSPSGSPNRYVGIWYKTIPQQTIVWVANRDSPLNHTSGVLRITTTGNILIFSDPQRVVWSSNSSKLQGAIIIHPVLEFLESGNLVVRDVNSGMSLLWQSFDYPSDTLLPGAKLGRNLKTGVNRYLSSWRSSDDPSYGGFTYGMDLEGYLETVLRNGSRKYYRGGPWNGIRHSGAPDLNINSIFTYEVVHNDDEIYYMYRLINQSLVMRSVLVQASPSSEAHLQLLTWVDKTKDWTRLVSIPRDRCDDYALCGAYGTCDVANVAVCKCLKGFKPKLPQDWSGTDWSQGCEREASLNCSAGDGFLKYGGVRLPDTVGTWVNTSMNLRECRAKCLMNCSCMAFTNTDIRGSGSGCIMWFADLIDIRQLRDAGQDIFIRMAASELDATSNSRTKKHAIIVASIAFLAGMVILGLVLWKTRSLKGLGCWYTWKTISPKDSSEKDDLELPVYDWVTILNATNNFVDANKLGEGGFGPVYKGVLEGEKEIAVKRLSRDSTQGVHEFKNEVLLISKLQHRNLVRLLGCCIHGEEKILVYEYMQNKSLDSSIFDERKSRLLDWNKRYQIILGIARGLVYLHHDSRLRIIHRDLKASNILLDSEMVPKISDFGMARLFGGDQIEEKTKRVVGTYGYMSPEYALDGKFSVKSDVFSFGVLVLEVISGKKNRSFSHPDHGHNLVGHAWRLWNAENSIELVDVSMRNSCCVEEVLRCIHIGLLCAQKGTNDRPTMSSVVLMLSSETVALPDPQPPGFYVERNCSSRETSSYDSNLFCKSNNVTLTTLESR